MIIPAKSVTAGVPKERVSADDWDVEFSDKPVAVLSGPTTVTTEAPIWGADEVGISEPAVMTLKSRKVSLHVIK